MFPSCSHCPTAVSWTLSIGRAPSTFVPPGDETGDEPQLRRSDLSQDKDPLDPQTAEAQRASNETAGMGWRPTNRVARMVEAARLCHPDSGRPAPVLSLAPPPTSSCLPSGHLPSWPSRVRRRRTNRGSQPKASLNHHSAPANSPFNPICLAVLNILNVL